VVETLGNMPPTVWHPACVARVVEGAPHVIPLISRSNVVDIIPGFDLWDMWPVQYVDGTTATFDGWTIWFMLSAPLQPDPESRHHRARIRMVTQKDGVWKDCGDLLPDTANPGSREWAGSALFDPASGRLTLFYTAAGVKGELTPTVAQRLFQLSARLTVIDGQASTVAWTQCAAMGITMSSSGPLKASRGRLKAFGIQRIFGTRRQAWTISSSPARCMLRPVIGTASSVSRSRPRAIMTGGSFYLPCSARMA
jgi:hypothetical protein